MRVLLVLLLVPGLAYAAQVSIDGGPAAPYRVGKLELFTPPPKCENPLEFDPQDTNSDGILDEGCPGLAYDPCHYGASIVKAYMQAAYTGFCLPDEPEPEPEPPTDCGGGVLVISPTVCPPPVPVKPEDCPNGYAIVPGFTGPIVQCL